MKKILLFAGLLIGGLSQLNAQCVITAACTPSAIGYCTVPQESTNLPNGMESTPYTTDVQFGIGSSVGGFATITGATITAVAGLPSGFNYSTNPSSGVFPPNSNACMQITGTTSTPGTYSVAVTFNVDAPPFPTTTQTLTWYLTIDAATGIHSYNKIANIFVAPNPANAELTVAATFNFGKVSVIDALGKIVISHDSNNSASTKINISDLSKGVYFLQMSDGSQIFTGKFVKE